MPYGSCIMRNCSTVNEGLPEEMVGVLAPTEGCCKQMLICHSTSKQNLLCILLHIACVAPSFDVGCCNFGGQVSEKAVLEALSYWLPDACVKARALSRSPSATLPGFVRVWLWSLLPAADVMGLKGYGSPLCSGECD